MRVIVVGAGVVGLSTADVLVRRGHDVRVLDAGVPMAARSLGGSRIFRLAHARADLVDAARRALPLWAAWSQRAGRALIGDEGAVVTGERVATWAAAMSAAGAAHTVGADPGTLPGPVDGPVLHDPAGGMIDVRGVGDLLRAGTRVDRGKVQAVGTGGIVVTQVGETVVPRRADAVVVTAGAGTAPLVRPLGVDVPSALVHHTRLSFRLRTPGAPPCWLDGDGGHGMATTYQHRTPEGWWAVGGHLPDEQCRDADEAARRWRAVLPAYATEHLPGVDPEPVEEIACTPTAGQGDGVHTARVGAVHALWGENLFKLAPLLGERLADAVVTDGVAHDIGAGPAPMDHRR